MTKLSDISQPNWTMSLYHSGKVVEGVDEISQNIIVIVRTQKGTDPLRPNFGTDLMASMDRPVNERVPQLIKDVVESINIWETRIDVTNVAYRINGDGGVDLEIEWSTRVGELTATTKVTINGAN